VRLDRTKPRVPAPERRNKSLPIAPGAHCRSLSIRVECSSRDGGACDSEGEAVCGDARGETRGVALVAEAWYAVYTKFQHEKRAASLLEKKGFEILLPVYRTVHRWKDRNQMVVLPLFPCYLFSRTNLERKLDILQTPGVQWLVESVGRACAIPDSEIEAVRKVTSVASRVEPHPFLKRGDRVRVCSGPLAGTEGLLERIKNQYRLVVAVELLQRSIAVEVELSNVEAVKESRGCDSHPLGGTRRTA
jgi:transcription antitermination factor NusG